MRLAGFIRVSIVFSFVTGGVAGCGVGDTAGMKRAAGIRDGVQFRFEVDGREYSLDRSRTKAFTLNDGKIREFVLDPAVDIRGDLRVTLLSPELTRINPDRVGTAADVVGPPHNLSRLLGSFEPTDRKCGGRFTIREVAGRPQVLEVSVGCN